jgi:hypothetical protein
LNVLRTLSRVRGIIRIFRVTPNTPSHGRSLAVIELPWDIDREAWRRLYYSEEVAALGTTKALKLKALPQEAYWYFYKALAFGSANPDEQPKLASLAMEIAELLDGAFLAGNIVASLMRANLNADFWLRLLQCLRDYTAPAHVWKAP